MEVTKMRKWGFLIVLLLILPGSSLSGEATGEVGRYQAIAFQKSGDLGPNEIFIIDTREGHMWTWTEYSTVSGVRRGGRYLTYHGKVVPGRKTGDVIEKQEFNQ
jgi:hypothetical protein